jgi:hypothetical protein
VLNRSIRIAAAMELALVIAEGVIPASTHGVLPLGGSHLAQLGTALGLAFVIAEILEGLLRRGDGA